MSSTDTNHATSSMGDVFDIEGHRRCLTEAMAELKKSIDSVLTMRVKAAELELELTSQHNPELQAKLKMCRESAEKYDCFMNSAANQK